MPNNILKIHNIPKIDHILTNNVNDEYIKIPDNFTSLESWPKRCNHSCYVCTNPIIYLPLFVPASIDFENGVIERLGKILFCSPSCMFYHIATLQHNREIYMRYARELIRRVSNIPIHKQSCDPSEDRSVLCEYGGTITRRDFREMIYLKNKEYFDILIPLIELGR